MYLDQAQHFVEPDQGTNCFQRNYQQIEDKRCRKEVKQKFISVYIGAQSPEQANGRKPPTPMEAPKDENDEEGSRPSSADSRKGILRPGSRSSSREGKRSRSPSGRVVTLIILLFGT